MMLVLLVWVGFVVWGANIGKKQGKEVLGAVLGLLLGVFGVLAIWLICEGMKKEVTR